MAVRGFGRGRALNAKNVIALRPGGGQATDGGDWDEGPSQTNFRSQNEVNVPRGGGFENAHSIATNDSGRPLRSGPGPQHTGYTSKPFGGGDSQYNSDRNNTKPFGGFGPRLERNDSKPFGGFGSRSDRNDSKPSGGFGSRSDRNDSKPFGGFGSRSDRSDSKPFGSSPNENNSKPFFGGFGPRPDSNYSKSSRGFGDRNSDSKPFGNRNSSFNSDSMTCNKCGEEGHFARNCDKSGGRDGDRRCFKCNESGHISRECPNSDSRGGGQKCYRCNQEGHFSRECPNSDSANQSGPECFKCHETGHIAKDCTFVDSSKPPPVSYVPPAPSEDETEIFRTIEKGINFDRYEKIGIKVTGKNKPRQISSFSQAKFSMTINENIARAGYGKPTPIQNLAIPIVMEGRDLMACAQSGSGKTAAFLLPCLHQLIEGGTVGGCRNPDVQEPQALIVAPTRELAVQISHEARKFSYRTIINSVVVYGGVSVNHQLAQLSRGADIIIGTPGRLCDFLDRRKISLAKIKYLILDEADRMLDMGFEPVIRKIVQNFDMPPKGERQSLFFSATFPDEIQKLAAEFLHDFLFVVIGTVGGANTDVEQILYEVQKNEKREKLLELLSSSTKNHKKTLVFVETKRSADFLASVLSQIEVRTTSIHGDRYQQEREQALEEFRTGRAPILIATSVAARGLDIPQVECVINYDMPKDINEYVHRIGRTGRCGNVGTSTSFFDPVNDMDMVGPLIRTLADAQQVVPQWLENYGSGSRNVYYRNKPTEDIRRNKQYAAPTEEEWLGDDFGGNQDDELWG